MAERRMFAKSIVLSDAFLDMPLSARCLYFTLGMLADDDGFVGSPKAIMRQCGASQDDMAVLLQKRYILAFESGVIVIKHWRMNNYLQNDRKKNTTYLEELDTLVIDDKGAYTEKSGAYTECLLPQNEKKGLTEAKQKRVQSIKDSSLPSTFDQQIRNAFAGKTCPICGIKMGYEYSLTKPTIQHNKPISLGGKHELDNISVICASCNSSIQNRVETPPYNTEEVKEIWECIRNVYTGKDSIDKISINNIYEQEFEEVWQLYPRKQGKESAKKAYIKARKQGAVKEVIEAGIKKYIDYIKRNKTEQRYIKQGSTWFNQRCWEDEYDNNGRNQITNRTRSTTVSGEGEDDGWFFNH